MEFITSLKSFVGPEYWTGGVMALAVALALIQYFKKMRTEDGRNEAEVQFRSDLFKQNAESRAEIKELNERADRFAKERNEAFLSAAKWEADAKSARAEITLLRSQLDECRAKQHGVE